MVSALTAEVPILQVAHSSSSNLRHVECDLGMLAVRGIYFNAQVREFDLVAAVFDLDVFTGAFLPRVFVAKSEERPSCCRLRSDLLLVLNQPDDDRLRISCLRRVEINVQVDAKDHRVVQEFLDCLLRTVVRSVPRMFGDIQIRRLYCYQRSHCPLLRHLQALPISGVKISVMAPGPRSE